VGEIPGYSCQIVADRAIQWLNKGRQPDQPFLLNVWFHEPHRKVAAPPHLLEKHPDCEDAAYLACVENMDQAIGRILKQLDQLSLSENTLVIFTSDNGSYREGSNDDFKGSKSWVWEGGIRVPMLMRLPGRIQPNSLNAVPCGGVDLMPTFCDLTNIMLSDADKLDGQSLTPVFRNEPINRKKPLFWFFYRRDPACALRDGDWSLIGYLNKPVPPGHSFRPSHQMYIKQTKISRFELYHLKEDPRQQNNVANKFPDRLQAMQKQMVTYHEQIIAEFVNWF